MSINNIKKILKKKNYFTIFLSASVLMLGLLYFLTLATVTDYSLKIFIMMNGLNYTLLTFFMLVLISFLFGLYSSLAVYILKCNSLNIKTGATGFSGFLAGIFGAGCPMCGSLIFGLFGAPLVLFFLPFKGLEIRAASIIILFASLLLVSKNLDNCRIKNKNGKA